MSVLALEVTLTRAFSVLLRFHYVFLAVSLATCGLGIGGVLDWLLRNRRDELVLGMAAMISAVAGIGGIALLFASPLSAHLTSLWVISACCLPPFAAAGVFLSRAFSVWGRQSGVVYFADLTGAALAAALVIVALEVGGAINAAFWACAMAAFAAALSWRRVEFSAAACLLAAGLAFAGMVNRDVKFLDLPALPLAGDPLAKPLYAELADPTTGARLIYTRWSALARTDVVAYAGPDGRIDPDADLYVYTDGEVPTNIIRYRGDIGRLAERYRYFIGLYAFRAVMPRRVMLIGPGGGLDVWLALMVGAEQIEGAEINGAIIDIVRRFRDFAGPVYDFRNVRVAAAEGRAFVEGKRKRYDIIYMALTKTATTATTSMALIESYAHTVEAFRTYFRHLTDRGALAFVCQSEWLLVREMLTAVAAMQAEGLSRDQALDRLLVVSVPPEQYRYGPYRHLMMMFRAAPGQTRMEELAKIAVADNLLPVFAGGVYEPQPLAALRDESLSLDEFVLRCNELWRGGQGRIDFRPCTDERPFIVDLTWGVPQPLRQFLIGAVIGVLLIAIAAVVVGKGSVQPVAKLAFVVYFAALGVAFMLVEIVLIQTFTLYLGHPVLSLATVLFGILVGAGLGSLVSQYVRRNQLPALVVFTVLAIAAFSAIMVVVGKSATGMFLWDVRLRALVVLATVAVFGFAMGMPFPAGLRVAVDAAGRQVVPWAWGVNGVASVAGSAAAMALAKVIGFPPTMAVGVGVYFLAAGVLYLAGVASRKVGR